uniref:SFRICE_002796 n=1 Tax=Spodoptera frugiperda TaxID=7108 RepID=A0A2H1W303_SPOFR
MATEWKPSVKEVNGINLANYFPHQRSYNSVVYIHKKYLDEQNAPEVKKEKVKPKKERKSKHDKCQQFNSEKNTEISNNNRTYKISGNNNDSVLEHTIRFAKNIVPLVIPQSDEKLPVYYTIKSSKKHKKREKKPQESFEHREQAYEKSEPKKVIETYRKVRKESFSVRESISSSNTLDDLNINQSLTCTLSELSEKKFRKKETHSIKKSHNAPKITVSESFEAIATENQGDSKIKIQLMNDKDKNVLTESIKMPILSAIKECISELSNSQHNNEMTTMQRILKCNTSKLDTILEKIARIEKRLEVCSLEKKVSLTDRKASSTVLTPSSKPSALEQLEEDLVEDKEDYSSEEELHQEMLDRRSKSAVTELTPDEKSGIKDSSLGAGEVGFKEPPIVGIKPTRPNRIPARFCWTDTARK